MNSFAKPIAVVLFAIVVAGFAGTSRAESRGKQTAEAHYQKGMKAYTLGHFPEAIEEFEKAYELRSEPIFLYNIAQSHRQNNSPQRAIFFYRRYLEAEPTAKNRADIEQRIKDMQSQLNAKAENAPAVAAPAPAPAPEPVAPVAAPVAPPPAPLVQIQTAPPPPANAGHGLRVAGISVGAVGVAGVVSGIFLGLHANSLYEEATKAGSVYDHAKEDSSKTFRTLEYVALGVGGAAVVAGTVLYVLGSTARSSEAPVALTPFLAPGAGGAALTGRF
jgi:tetratricopeptide (TPR) repeat protein